MVGDNMTNKGSKGPKKGAKKRDKAGEETRQGFERNQKTKVSLDGVA